MKYILKIFIVLLLIFTGCSTKKISIKQFEQADIIHNDVKSIESFPSGNKNISYPTDYLLFLVKNPQKNIEELCESLDSYSKNYLRLHKQNLLNAIRHKYPETSETKIFFLYYKTSKMLPWDWESDNIHLPPIEGYPVDLIGYFIFNVNSDKFEYISVMKRSKNIFHYGKIIEEIVRKEK